ncbi:MAG: hypothetical protein K8F29_07385 [Kofleriaceae bacterium]|nr:hypothetical protein [Candidatus Methylomirabilis lanthanidiphila]
MRQGRRQSPAAVYAAQSTAGNTHQYDGHRSRLTLLPIFVLLYFNCGSLANCLIVLLPVPFSLLGGI